MGLSGQAIAGGFEAAGRTAADTIGTAIKFAYMNELEEAKALREEHMAQLRGDLNLEHEKYVQGSADDREALRYGRAVMGYLNGKPVTNADYANMSETEQAKVTNDKAYAAGLIQQTEAARSGNTFVGEDASGQAWTQKDIDRYRTSHGGKLPPGFKTEEQIKIDISRKHLENEGKKIDAYVGKSNENGGKPLTENQRSLLLAKATKMFSDAQKNSMSLDGSIPDVDLDAINQIRESVGAEPLVPVQKVVTPAKIGWFGTEPAKMGWDYVPASEAGKQQKSGLIESSSAANSLLSGKPSGRYRVNGQIIKWNGKQVIQ